MSNFTVVSAELAGKIRDYLHGCADYDERALLREVLLGGVGVVVVTDGVPANVPAASIYDADAGHLRNALGNTKWSEVPLDKLRAVAEALSPQERAPGAMTALHERLQDVIADMRAHANNDRQAEYGEDDSVSISYVLGWADRLETATALQSSGGEVVAGKWRQLTTADEVKAALDAEQAVEWTSDATDSIDMPGNREPDSGGWVPHTKNHYTEDRLFKIGKFRAFIPASPAQPSGFVLVRTDHIESMEILGRQCLDGGKCHHACLDKCFRRGSCAPLSIADSYLRNDWTLLTAAPAPIEQEG